MVWKLSLLAIVLGFASVRAEAPGELFPGTGGKSPPEQRPSSPADALVSNPPKSKAAVQAETKFDLDMRKLDAEYQQKAVAIQQAYANDLKTALKGLAKSDNVDPDEIVRLSSKIKEVQATVPQAPSPTTVNPKRITGKWRETWGDGSKIIFFRNNGVLTEADGRQSGSWWQDGSRVICLYPDGHSDIAVLANDGKSMRGCNATYRTTPVTFTFVGD
jgi:hypothetical protein